MEQLDFVYVIGDAYVDHPSFGHAIISRLLEAHGYTVGIISQPDWKNDESIAVFGKPRLGFLVSAGRIKRRLLSLAELRPVFEGWHIMITGTIP